MTRDSGALSIDFLAGFTIFLIAFVWVISLIPGLLIGLQAHTVDYDAVAYRTGVILVEDPGATTGMDTTIPWESLPPEEVARFGLAISRNTPNILSEERVDRFFDSAVFTRTDYREKAIFGDYPYRFNISLRDVDKNLNSSVGDVLPEGYGYIRRLVKIKGMSNASIDRATILAEQFKNSDNATTHIFSILVDTPGLYSGMTDPSYQIDPVRDQMMINITDLDSPSIMNDPTAKVTLTNISVQREDYFDSFQTNPNLNISLDGVPVSTLPHEVTGNISIKFSPKFFQKVYEEVYDPSLYEPVLVNLTFNLDRESTFLNNTWSSPFDYNYTSDGVTPPQLRDAVVEVAAW